MAQTFYKSSHTGAEMEAMLDTFDSMATEYSSASTYAVGDWVTYQSALYRCTTAITTPEAWTAAHWTAKKLVDVVNTLEDGVLVVSSGKLCAVFEQ